MENIIAINDEEGLEQCDRTCCSEYQEIDKEREGELVAEFVKEHGIACGGNWAAMLMSTIRRGLPEVFKEMKDKSYSFEELYSVIAENIVKDVFDEQQYWEDRADNNPDDGSWVGR